MRESGLRVRRAARAVVVGGASLLAILHGCFVDIPDPVPLMNDASTDSGGSANGGSSAGSSGSSASGGNGGSTSTGGTGAGGTGAGGTSGAGGSGGADGAACDAVSCVLPHADATCGANGRCAITACNPGFLDCNGDPADGCELGAPAAADLEIAGAADAGDAEAGDGGVTYLIPKLSDMPDFFADAGVYVWNQLSPIRFATVCGPYCNPNGKPGGQDLAIHVEKPGELPPTTQHIGYFRVGHTLSSLFVLATVWDSEIVDGTTTFDAGADAGTLPGADAEHEDGIELLIDAPDGTSNNYGPSDHHLFIGASGRTLQFVSSTSEGSPSPSQVSVQAERIGAYCYVIQAELTQSYIVTDAAVPTFGFAITVNDWRTLPGETLPQRVYQVFWKTPGQFYAYDVTGFPRVEFGP